MEEAMRDYETYPPMRVWGDSLKYIFATVLGRIFPWCRPKEEQLDQVYNDLLASACEMCPTAEERERDIAGIKKLWPKLREKLENNAGLVKFMNDCGSRSRSFAQFPATLVPRAIALESAFGTNYDNAGVYHKLLPGCISTRCGAVEPEFVELRRRAWFARGTIFHYVPELADYATEAAPKKLARVITLGAGLLIEMRKFGMTLTQLQSLDIVACDMDDSLLSELDVVFMHDFGVPFKEAGIQYRSCRIEDVMADKTLWGTATVVLMDGVLSYCRDNQHMLEYVAGMMKLVKLGGCAICDLQVMEVSLVRCALVQCWESTMKPEWSAKAAVRKLRWICRKLGIGLEYKVDPRNPRPLGVIFRLTHNPPQN